MPTAEEKAEARRLFAQALAVVTGVTGLSHGGYGVGRGKGVGRGDEDGMRGKADSHGEAREESEIDAVRAQVQLMASGLNPWGGQGVTSGKVREEDDDHDGTKERHLREATRAALDTKAGLTARRVTGHIASDGM